MLAQETRIDNLIIRMREKGCRMTPQRMAVLNVLIGNEEHLSVEQIYDRVKSDFPMTSIATVYKTITMLKDMDEIQELKFNGDSKRYDGQGLKPHPHLICTVCDRVTDLDFADLSHLSQEVEQATDYQVIRFQFDFYGICPQCQEDTKKL